MLSRNVNGLLMNSTAANQKLLDMYLKLSIVVQSINSLMREYSRGNFYAVANILTQEMYKKLSINLAGLVFEPNKYTDYEIIRASSTSALAGLYQSIIQYTEYVDIQAQLEICKEHDAILHDPKLLQEWINQMNKRSQLFPDSNVQVIAATLKPEYAEYIKQFGFPEGAVFETDKLALILKQLNMA